MRTIIIEDEQLPAQRLEKLLKELVPGIEIVAVLQSIDESIEWFRGSEEPELVFMDIHLADGTSFSIFDEVKIYCPIIFTTAYDQYALKAFEVNSVDYLLKPIRKEDLKRALDKMKMFASSGSGFESHSELISKLATSLMESTPAYKQSLLVAIKDTLLPLAVKDIAYFYLENKMVKAVRHDNKAYNLDYSLEDLGKQLNPKDFFRANRQYIISRSAVKDIAQWFGNRVAINLSVQTPERIVISRTHVREFKNWVTS